MKKVALLSMTVLSFCGVNVHADKAVPAAHEKQQPAKLRRSRPQKTQRLPQKLLL
jgi:hypothetical protein